MTSKPSTAWKERAEAEERRRDASREEVAHRVAQAAVKKGYRKGNRGK